MCDLFVTFLLPPGIKGLSVTKVFLDRGAVSRIDLEALSPLNPSPRCNGNRLFSNCEDGSYLQNRYACRKVLRASDGKIYSTERRRAT